MHRYLEKKSLVMPMSLSCCRLWNSVLDTAVNNDTSFFGMVTRLVDLDPNLDHNAFKDPIFHKAEEKDQRRTLVLGMHLDAALQRPTKAKSLI